MALSSQVSQASPCPDHIDQAQDAEQAPSTTVSASGREMEGNELRAEAKVHRPLSPSSPSPAAPPVLHRGRRSRTLCQTDEDLKFLGKTVARLDFGSDDEQGTVADARQAEAVADAARGGGSVHDVSPGSVHADCGAASGVGREHSVPVRHDEVEHARDEESVSMEHGERGERGGTGERRDSGEEDEGETAAGAEEGGASTIQGGIKKKKRRSKGAKNFRQRQDAAQQARRGSALQGGSVLPFGV